MAHNERQKAHAQVNSLQSFLGSLTIGKPSGKTSMPYKKRWAKQRDENMPCSHFSDIQIDQLQQLVLCSMGNNNEARFSNHSTKPAYEREGAAGLDEIPEHKLESIPESLLNEFHESHEYTKVRISGPPILRDRIRKLVKKYKVFLKAPFRVNLPKHLNLLS